MSHAKWENVHICQFVAGTISSTSNHFRCLSFFSTRPFYDTLVDAVWGRCKDAFGQAWGLCEAQTGPPPSHEDMEKDMEIGAKHGWKYTWAVEDMPTVHCYGAVREEPSSSPSSSLMFPADKCCRSLVRLSDDDTPRSPFPLPLPAPVH